jgi:predicted ribosomally synthesized peptide with SipW-like signal peptide
MFRITLAFLLVAGLLAGVSVAGSAYFTDSATVANNVFSTGKIKIKADLPTSTSLTLAKMAPGDKVTAPLTVANDPTDGDVDFMYTMAASSTGDSALSAALVMEVKTGVTTCSNAGFSGSGSQIATGSLNNTIGFTSPVSRTLLGNVSASGTKSEVLCFQVRLPETNVDQTALTNPSKSVTTDILFTAVSVPHFP